MYNMPMQPQPQQYNTQPQQYNITSFVATMMTLGLMSSLFGGITGGIGGSAVMTYSPKQIVITRDDIKREVYKAIGEYWYEVRYEAFMSYLRHRLPAFIVSELHRFTSRALPKRPLYEAELE